MIVCVQQDDGTFTTVVGAEVFVADFFVEPRDFPASQSIVLGPFERLQGPQAVARFSGAFEAPSGDRNPVICVQVFRGAAIDAGVSAKAAHDT